MAALPAPLTTDTTAAFACKLITPAVKVAIGITHGASAWILPAQPVRNRRQRRRQHQARLNRVQETVTGANARWRVLGRWTIASIRVADVTLVIFQQGFVVTSRPRSCWILKAMASG